MLAHELSHVTQRHIARSISAGKTSSFVGIAGLLLGVLVASRNPEAANALIAGGQAVAVQGQLNFSRDMEREADRVGFGVFTAAGYEPGGMAAMFEKLQQASRLNDSQSFPYLRTHPLTSARIGEARARLGVDAAQLVPRSLAYAVIRARARVLMDTRDVASAARCRTRICRPGRWRSPKRPTGSADCTAARWLRCCAATGNGPMRPSAAARPLAAADKAATFMLELLKLDALIARNDAAGAASLLERLLTSPAAAGFALAAAGSGAGRSDAGSPTSDARAAAERLQTWVALHRRRCNRVEQAVSVVGAARTSHCARCAPRRSRAPPSVICRAPWIDFAPGSGWRAPQAPRTAWRPR